MHFVWDIELLWTSSKQKQEKYFYICRLVSSKAAFSQERLIVGSVSYDYGCLDYT